MENNSTIEIFLHTNIPNQTEPIVLKNNTLHDIQSIKGKSEYPFFTDTL